MWIGLARASLPVCGGTRETDGRGETSKRSLLPSFMNRLYPAETRLKEGAHAHDSGQNRWECSLAAGWWRPVSALLAVSSDCRFDVKRGRSNRAPNRSGTPAADSQSL